VKKVLRIIRFIYNHPLSSRHFIYATCRLIKWQIVQRLLPYPVLFPFVEKSKLLIEKGMTGATGNIYTGLLEFEDMAFLLHILKNNDLFVDVGANVGVYSVLASVNTESNVISIEPIPSTFDKLKKNIFLNNATDRVQLVQAGVASQNGELIFTVDNDTVNHVINETEKNVPINTVKVPVYTLDEICKSKEPLLIKIDVEGFEWEVLNGASAILQQQMLKALIIELNGSGERYGYSDANIHSYLVKYGFTPYRYYPFERRFEQLDAPDKHNNTIYIRDINWVMSRIGSARKFEVFKSFI